MRTLSFVSLSLVLASAAMLSACGGSGISPEDLASAKIQAADEATKAEAAKTDSKLSAAKAEIKKLAVDTARQGGFSSSANCNVLPQGLLATSAAKNFPSNTPLEYKAICTQEVASMNAERAAMKSGAVAAAKKAEQKFIAQEKRKQAELLAGKKANTARHDHKPQKPQKG